ncbi:MAG: carbohydrate ABC transporter permease [Chloroflexota bacterium]|nr:carbohydrate ABC transporter permease [Chloroflexota bacterium]
MSAIATNIREIGKRRRARAAWIYGGVVLLALWTLVPLYWLLFLSLTPPIVLLHDPIPLVPAPPTAANFAWLLTPGNGQAALVRAGFANSFLVASLVTILTLAVATPAAYAVSRSRFRGAMIVHGAVLASRAYPPIALAVPFFWLYARLDLLGTRHGLIAAYLGATVPLAVWVLMSIFAGLSPTVLAAARLDGNTPWQVFWRVAVPLARPGIVAAGVITFTGCWNEFVLAQFLTAGSSAQTFPLAVAPLLSALPNEMAAALIVSLTPAIALAVAFRDVFRSLVRVGVE